MKWTWKDITITDLCNDKEAESLSKQMLIPITNLSNILKDEFQFLIE